MNPGIRGLFNSAQRRRGRSTSWSRCCCAGERESTLTRGERELIAAYVSALNECNYCSNSHAAYAAAQLPGGMALVEQVRADVGGAPISAKLKALLAIAAAVAQSGLNVSDEQVTTAREAGATDVEIHDTVLIAAAFCMFNRYVDGLATTAPADPALLRRAGGADRQPTATWRCSPSRSASAERGAAAEHGPMAQRGRMAQRGPVPKRGGMAERGRMAHAAAWLSTAAWLRAAPCPSAAAWLSAGAAGKNARGAHGEPLSPPR